MSEHNTHTRPEPPEEPPFCDICMSYGHSPMHCTDDDQEEEDE